MRSLLFVVWAFALCTGACVQGAPPDHSVIEMRIARTSSAPGYAQGQAVADTTFFVNDTVLVSDSDIEHAHAQRTKDGAGSTILVINVRLTAQAGSRVAKSTRSHVGDRLAVFLDQQLVAAPPIMGEVGGSRDLELIGGPPAPLERIVAAVAARWPDHH